MQKKWTLPEIQELDISATTYHPQGGPVEDGVYTSHDGEYEIPTFAPSGDNSGIPDVDVDP